MRAALTLALAGCSSSPVPGPGDISVTSDGTSIVHATACLDSDFFGCHRSDANLALIHEGKTTAMPYGAFGVGYHACDADLGDPTKSFVVTDGVANATVFLPPAFELSGGSDQPLTRDDRLHLTWDRDSTPMRWDFDYECGTLGGSIDGGEVDDDGAGDIDLGRIGDAIADAHVSTETCMVLIKLSRIGRGLIDTSLANSATGTQVRSIAITFAR